MEMNEEERETAAGGLAFEAEKLGQHYAAGSQCNSFTLDCTQSGAQSKYEYGPSPYEASAYILNGSLTRSTLTRRVVKIDWIHASARDRTARSNPSTEREAKSTSEEDKDPDNAALRNEDFA